MVKVNNKNTRTRWQIRSKLTVKIPERRLVGFFFVNYEHMSQLFLVFLFSVTLNELTFAGKFTTRNV